MNAELADSLDPDLVADLSLLERTKGRLVVLAHPRSGTRTGSEFFRRLMGWTQREFPHESLGGEKGQVSFRQWKFQPDDLIVHLVRDPFPTVFSAGVCFVTSRKAARDLMAEFGQPGSRRGEYDFLSVAAHTVLQLNERAEQLARHRVRVEDLPTEAIGASEHEAPSWDKLRRFGGEANVEALQKQRRRYGYV